MKVMLVNAPQLKSLSIEGDMYPPLGILYLAAYARERIQGLHLKIMDGSVDKYKTIVEGIESFQPDVLGVSFTTFNAPGAYKLINEVKKRVQIPHIIAGGPHATIRPVEVLKKTVADLVVGEGEETFVEILERICSGGSIESICGTLLRVDGTIVDNGIRPFISDLDTLPFPARDLIDLKRYKGNLYKKRKRDTSIISSRGCPFNCTYCSNPVWKTQKPWFRGRSPENVLAEMQDIVDTYGIREFYDLCDELNVNKKWLKSLCDRIKQSGLDISWKAQLGIDNIDEELSRKLEQAGFWMGMFGLESSHDRTLKGIDKKQTVAQIEKNLGIISDNTKIKCFGFFMAFNAWEENGELCFESKEDCMKTLDFIKRLLKEKKLDAFGWAMATPLPGSNLNRLAEKYELFPEGLKSWDQYDATVSQIMRLRGINEKDWFDVLERGKSMQAKRLFTGRYFRLSLLPKYIQKTYYLTLSYLKNVVNKFN